jgi:hypothetical protein
LAQDETIVEGTTRQILALEGFQFHK